jgi:hypothetical protein
MPKERGIVVAQSTDVQSVSHQKLVAVERVERTVVKRTQRTEVNGSVVDTSVDEFVSESSEINSSVVDKVRAKSCVLVGNTRLKDAQCRVRHSMHLWGC